LNKFVECFCFVLCWHLLCRHISLFGYITDIPQIELGTSQILPEFGSLGKAEPSRLCVNRALFMRPGRLAPKAATFFVIKTHLSRGLGSNA
jgi:hypothetical protein